MKRNWRARTSRPNAGYARVAALLKLNVSYPFFHRLMIDELVNRKTPAAVRFLDQLTREGVAAYFRDHRCRWKGPHISPYQRSASVTGGHRQVRVPYQCHPVLRIALGKHFEQRAISLGDREFICDILLNGLKARSSRSEQ